MNGINNVLTFFNTFGIVHYLENAYLYIVIKNKDTMKATEIKVGQKVEFTTTGKIFEIAKVTENRISWYFGGSIRSSYGKVNQRMAWDSIKGFQKGMDSGEYKLL